VLPCGETCVFLVSIVQEFESIHPDMPKLSDVKNYHKYKVFLKPLVIRPGFGHTLHLDYSGPYPDSGEGPQLFDIIKISTSSYSPRSNSKIERLQKTLIECLKALDQGLLKPLNLDF